MDLYVDSEHVTRYALRWDIRSTVTNFLLPLRQFRLVLVGLLVGRRKPSVALKYYVFNEKRALCALYVR
jgi:hypothetical protein